MPDQIAWRIEKLARVLLLAALGALAVLAALLAFASAPATASADGPAITRLEMLEDPSGKMSFAEAVSAPLWREIDPDGFAGGYAASAFWFRLTLESPRAGRAVLSLLPSYVDDLRIHVPAEYADPASMARRRTVESVELYQQGDLFAMSFREYPWRGFTVPVLMPQDAPVTILVRMETTSTNAFVPAIHAETEFLAMALGDGLLYGALIAAVLAAFIFGLVQFAIARDRLHRQFLTLASAALVFLISLSGHIAMFLPDWPILASEMVGVSICLLTSAVIAFTREAVRIERISPRLDRFTTYAVYVCLGCALLAAFGFYARFVALFMPLTFLVGAYIVGVTLVSLRQGLGHSRFLVPAYAATLVGYIYGMLVNIGVVPGSSLGLLAIPLALVVTLFLMLMVLYEESRLSLDDRDRARLDAASARVAADLNARSLAAQRNWVSIVSHELKTPLAVIDSARQNIESLEPAPAIAERTAKIARAVHQIDGLVQALLHAEELDARIKALRHERFNVAAMARACIEDAGVRAASLYCDPGLEVAGDSQLLSVALSNFITNAARHGVPDAPVEIMVRREPRNGPGLLFSVTDEGPTIGPGAQARLFEKHYKVGRAAGHGIGLWASAAIAAAHGGVAWYEVPLAGGNRFCLWIPE